MSRFSNTGASRHKNQPTSRNLKLKNLHLAFIACFALARRRRRRTVAAALLLDPNNTYEELVLNRKLPAGPIIVWTQQRVWESEP